MKDSQKAVVRTIMWLAGAYFCYQTRHVRPAEPIIYYVIGGTLLLGAMMSKIIGFVFVSLGVALCVFDYFKAGNPGFGPNFDPAAYVIGLICFIVGGIFLAIAPNKKRKPSYGEDE